jgi:hypothetical protein
VVIDGITNAAFDAEVKEELIDIATQHLTETL